MPEIQVIGGNIAHDIQYYLDGAVGCMDIAPDVYLWAKLFHPNITQLVDSFDDDATLRAEHHGEWLVNCSNRLERLYLDWQVEADTNSVALCLAYGLTYGPEIEWALLQVANTLVDDKCSMLAGIPYYDSARTHEKDGLVYYDGLKLFQRKRGFFESLRRIRVQWEALEEKPDLTRMVLKYPPRPLPPGREIIDITDFDLAPRDRRRKARILPKEKKKALKKSADLLDTITGQPTTKLFLSGDEVSVTGQKYRFSLTKERGSSLNTSHGAAVTRVYDAATDEFICGLCVYTAGVTVFDHLASIVLHCKSGLEDMIIMDANITTKGRLDLLPMEKHHQLELQRQRWAKREVEVIDLAGVEAELDIIEENPIARGLWGLENKARMLRQNKVKAANDLAQRKLSRRIKRKYPELFAFKPLRFEAIQQLICGPEVGA